MGDNLFGDFSKVSDSEWMDRIVEELKGKDPGEKLYYKTPEDLTLQPFYSSETTDRNLKLDVKSDWFTCHNVDLSNSDDSFSKVQESEPEGFDALYVRYSDVSSLKKLLEAFKGKITRLHLDFVGPEPPDFKDLQIPDDFDVLTNGFDVFSQVLESGVDPDRLLEGLCRHCASQPEGNSVRHLFINAGMYKNAGAKMYQEIGCILSELQEYIEVLKKNKHSVFASNITVKVACGTDYFMEIAKLRSVRLLIANLLKANDLNYNDLHIIAEVSNETTSLKDSYTNILRFTTSNISAVIGGCDSLVALPFSSDQKEFATRISKNIQLMLKHEGHFNKVANPANGSYFIEQLSVELSEKAWEYFKELEQSGGFIENMRKGTIQKNIVKSARERMNTYRNNEKILIGVNKYQIPGSGKANPKAIKKEKNAIEPLQTINYAQELESEN